MEVIALSLTATHEAFTITGFIVEVISTIKSQSDDFACLQTIFEQHQLYLKTFAKWFVTESKTSGAALLYQHDDRWRGNVMKMFMELKRLISEYARLAVKYDNRYQQALDFIEDGQWIQVQVPDNSPGVEGVKLQTPNGELVGLMDIFNKQFIIPKERDQEETMGLRARWAKKLRILEWGLFDYKRLSELVRKQEEWIARLIALMKFALLPIISQDVTELQSLTTGEKGSLGFSALALKRLAILDELGTCDQEIDASKLKSVTTSLLGAAANRRLIAKRILDTIVLVEYKLYQVSPGEPPGPNFEIAQQRVRCITRMLSVVSNSDQVEGRQMAHLRSLGYFHEAEKHRLAIIYAVPPGCDPTPVSLHHIISSKEFRGALRPTLDERFKIAQSIGRALLEWFLVDWVHKSVSSIDVAFFRQASANTGTYNFSTPYLCGFEYARQAQGVSIDVYAPVEFEQMVYRHPARQGVPTEAFGKIHDVYAFGVLLLEIGLWQVARDMFPPKQLGQLRPGIVKKELVRNAKERLGHYMGSRYRGVVLACLEGSFGFKQEEDNMQGMKLMSAFREKVLDALDEGISGLAEC